MAEVRRILNWISKSTAGTAPVRSGKMLAGNLNFQMALQQADFYDPFDIRIGQQTHIRIRPSIKFTYQTPRRIRYTPFITTYGYHRSVFIWTIDFTAVSEPTACHRIVLFQCLDRTSLPSFTMQKTGAGAENRTYEISPGFFIQTGATWQRDEEEKWILLKPVPDTEGEAYATLQFGDKARFIPEDEPLRFFRELTKESENSRSVYPLKYFFTGGSTALSLEEIWFTQTLLTPDGKAGKSVFTSGKESDRWLPWLWMISFYLPHSGLAEQLRAYADACRRSGRSCTPRVAYLIDRMCNAGPAKNVKKGRNDLFATVFRSGDPDGASGDRYGPGYFHRALFGESPDAGETINRLQEWWNRYAMPVYNLRWRRELDCNTEFFFIIYLLALRHKMPWAGLMSDRCGGFSGVPLFALLAKMSARIMLHRDRDGNLRISPGSARDSNVVRTPAREFPIRASYTKFGSATYFTLQKNEHRLLKVDKETTCVVDKSSQNFSLLPHIYPLWSEFPGVSLIKAEFGTESVRLPLVWRKGMLRFGNARIRWLLKKERFQVTIQALADLEGFRMNDQTVNLKRGQRKILYTYPEKAQGSAKFSVLTEEGRTIHERKNTAGRQVHLAGWASDRYGVFIPGVNYRHHVRQHPLEAEDAGQITASVCIPSEAGRISILAKRFEQDFELCFMRNQTLAKFMTSDPAASGNYRILIDRRAGGDPAELLRYFEGEFGVLPELIMIDHPYPDEFSRGIIVCPADESSRREQVPGETVLVIPAPPDRSLDRMIRDELYHLQS